MSAFVKKYSSIIILSIIGTVIGFLFFLRTNNKYIYRIEYEYRSEIKGILPENLKNDTLIAFKKDILVRNYKSSIADTAENKGLLRGELKIQTTHLMNNKEKFDLAHEFIQDENVNILQIKGEEIKKPYRLLFYGAITGFFMAVVFKYFSSINSPNPRKTDNTTPN